MDFPRNPPAPREQIKERRPGVANVYTPGLTVPGGMSGLTQDEYSDAIMDHDPLVSKCLNKFKWHLLSGIALGGIGGRFWAKHHGFRMPATILTTTIAATIAGILGANTLPGIRCHPEERNAFNHAVDLSLYGPWKRDSGEEQLFRPKEMEMDDDKWIRKGHQPPSQRSTESL